MSDYAVECADVDLVDDREFFALASKTCSRCKCEKPLSRFGKNHRAKDGLKYACYDCTNAASAAYRAANPEREKAKKARYRAAHAPSVKAYNDEYRRVNYQKCLDLQRAWRSANPDKAKAATARWQAANKGALRRNNQNRRARKAFNGGIVSRGIEARLMGLQRGRCAACGTGLRKAGHHLDHIKPLAKRGQHADNNLQLLCPPCNMSKHARDPVDFMQSRGFLL